MMQKIDRKEFVEGVAALGVALDSGAMTFSEARLTLDCRKLFKSPMAAANFIDKSILEKWYSNQPGGSLHDVYVVEIEGVYEG